MAYQKQQLVLDLTGRNGLIDKYYGDINNFGFTADLQLGQPQYRIGLKSASQSRDGQVASGIYNPLRKYGYLSPSVATIYAIASAQTDAVLIGSQLYDSINDKVYQLVNITGTANPAPLFRYDGIDSGTIQTDRTMPSGTIGGHLAIYQVNGVRSLFYSYHTGSEWRAGYKELTGNTFVDNWLGTGGSVSGTFAPSSNGEMKFIPSGDGFMYILNANSVHRADGSVIGGANGTVVQNVLLAPTYFRFSHGVDFRSNLYLAIQKNTVHEVHNATIKEGLNYTAECGVYIWNRQAAFSNTSDYIPINGVREIRALWVSPKNDVRCITIAANGVTQIRVFNGTEFQVVKELGACAFPNYTDSLTVVGGFTVWLGYDGNLYYHGSEGVDITQTSTGSVRSEKEFLFIMGTVGGTGIQNVLGGSILYAGSNGFATGGTEKTHIECFNLSYSIGGVAKIGKFFPFANNSITGGVTTATTAVVTPITYPITSLPFMATVKHITVFMAREKNLTPAQDEATIKLFKNGDTSEFMSKTVTTDDVMKGYISIEVNTPYIDLLQLSITYGATAVTNRRFNPSYAVVDYFPSDTLK